LHLDRLDHLVLTVADIERTCAFYERVLGMEAITFGDGRRALRFGDHKINLHQAGREFAPFAAHPTPGSADLCFTTSVPLSEVIAHIQACAITIIEGPVRRSGAVSDLESIYLRDPDGNLIEVSNQIRPSPR
jgi:catechol 2,3-dioxygenase-like lactoylglutathione lyase family enzyme